MKDFSSLQIDARCIKCGRLSSNDVVLYEMRNHLFICASCQQQAEAQGKQIAWAADAPSLSPSTLTVGNQETPTTRKQGYSLPPDSLFAVLKLSLDAPLEDIEDALALSMKQWTRAPKSSERTEMLDRLQEWQELLDDLAALEQYRTSLKPQRKGNALSVGGRLVLTAQEFVAACEASKEGWADGVRYLRMGQLKQWALFQLADKDLATNINFYQTWREDDDFRAFNEALYRINPERPFRMYESFGWHALSSVRSVSTLQELADYCDQHWYVAEKHLYEGALVFWANYCQKIKELHIYFDEQLARYANQPMKRGVGLELFLERVLPDVSKPQLKVTFDGRENGYMIDKWDIELRHEPVTVMVENMTRGYTLVDLVLDDQQSGELVWAKLTPYNPLRARGLPQQGFPITSQFTFLSFNTLKRGTTYHHKVTLYELREGDTPTPVQKFPLTLRTLRFYEGLRGKLWLWGLRGNVPALFWNGLVALILSFLILKVLLPLIPDTWMSEWTTPDNIFWPIIHVASALVAFQLQTLDAYFLLGYCAVIGIASFMTGKGKGFTNETELSNAHTYRLWTGWLFLLATIVLIFWSDQLTLIGMYLQEKNANTWLNILPYFVCDVSIYLLCILSTQIIIIGRKRLEKYLLQHYASLLDLPGRER